jgi:hypothetical protein
MHTQDFATALPRVAIELIKHQHSLKSHASLGLKHEISVFQYKNNIHASPNETGISLKSW